MNRDAFSTCHPAVNFIFFVGAIGLGVVISHPAYLLVGIAAASAYYLALNGVKGLKRIAALLPLFVLLTVINPLFNTQGNTVLFLLFGRPYTLEALLYGSAIAGIFVVMTLWFGCYNQVLTGDKFTSLFGNVLPVLSLLLVMVLRMIPNLIRKGQQITGARKSIGKGSNDQSPYMEKVNDGMTVLSALTSWALEGGVITGDSMRSRGYGCGKRTSFQLYSMTGRDRVLIILMVPLLTIVLITIITGGTAAAFTPDLQIAPVKGPHVWGLVAYGAYLSIPIVLQMKEAVQWRISRSRI